MYNIVRVQKKKSLPLTFSWFMGGAVFYRVEYKQITENMSVFPVSSPFSFLPSFLPSAGGAAEGLAASECGGDPGQTQADHGGLCGHRTPLRTAGEATEPSAAGGHDILSKTRGP